MDYTTNNQHVSVRAGSKKLSSAEKQRIRDQFFAAGVRYIDSDTGATMEQVFDCEPGFMSIVESNRKAISEGPSPDELARL